MRPFLYNFSGYFLENLPRNMSRQTIILFETTEGRRQFGRIYAVEEDFPQNVIIFVLYSIFELDEICGLF